MNIAIIQTDLLWEDIKGNLAGFDRYLEKLNPNTDLVVLPEMFSTGFSMNANGLAEPLEGATFQWMVDKADALQAVIAGSYIVMDEGKYYNRFYMVRPDGSYHYYDKRHLFTLAKESDIYTPGHSTTKVSLDKWSINLQVCYDLRFPARLRADLPFDLVLFVASWPEKRIDAWTTLLKARAIENQCYVVGVNRIGRDDNNIQYNGQSIVYDPLGDTIVSADDQPGIFYAELSYSQLEKIRQQLPFLNDRDRITID